MTRCDALACQERAAGALVPLSLPPVNCALCAAINHLDDDALAAPQSGHSRNAVVLDESEHFVLIRDICPVVPGHSLVVSRQHLSCFAHTPAEYANELRAFKRRAWAIVAETFGTPFIFEHGAAGTTGAAGSCVDHAHLHLFPMRAPVAEWIAELGEACKESSDLPPLHATREPYLWYQDQDGEGWLVAHLVVRPPCQFIRRRVATLLGTSQWDWRTSSVTRGGATTHRTQPTEAGLD